MDSGTNGHTTSWTEYLKICEDGVPVDNHMEGDRSLRVKKEEEEGTKQRKKKAKHSPEDSKKQEANTKSTWSDGDSAAKKKRRKPSRAPAEETHHGRILSSEPSLGLATREVLGTISQGVTPRATGKIIPHLLDQSGHGGEGGDLVAVRISANKGEQRVECRRRDMTSLRPGKWLNNNTINFVGLVDTSVLEETEENKNCSKLLCSILKYL